jgi:hypothetical protein
MLRKIVLLCIFLPFAVPAMPQQQKPPGQQDARKSQRDTKQADVPAAPITNNQATAYYEQPRENKPQGWHKLVTWPEGITAWAILFTLGAIIWQAVETRKAAIAARDSINTFISKERARLRIEVEPLNYEWPKEVSLGPPIDFKLCYNGTTEAFIKISEVWCDISDSKEPCPGKISSILDIPKVITKDTVLKEQKALIWPSLSGDTLQEVKDGKSFVHFYGFVRYTDVFDKERETGWYYPWSVEAHPYFPEITNSRWVRRKCAGYDQET